MRVLLADNIKNADGMEFRWEPFCVKGTEKTTETITI